MPFADIYESHPNVISVATDWNEKELIQSIPGARYTKNNGWQLPLTWMACVQLRGIFQDRLRLGDRLIEWARDTRYRYVDTATYLRTLLHPEIEPDPFDRLFPFQRVAVDFMIVSESGLIGDEMGVGKTIELIGYIDSLGAEAFPLLIICPNSVKSHWATRIEDWLPNVKPFVYESSRAKKDKLFETIDKELHNAVVIVNFEAMRSLSRLAPFGNTALKKCVACDKYSGDPEATVKQCQVHPKELNRIPFKTVIVDEAHRIKEPKSQQTRAVWAVCHAAAVQHVWMLTGTPIANNVSDLWSLMHAAAKDEYPTKSKFVERYALTSWNEFGGLDVIGLNPNTAEEFRSAFNPRFRRVTKAEVLPQLPPKMYTVREVDMTPSQRKAYNELESSLMCRTDDGQLLIAKTQLAAATRLSQLACSSVKITSKPDPDDPSTWTIELKMPSPKIDELMLVVEELGSRQAVIAAEHSKLIDLACVELTKAGVAHLKITGDVSPHDRQRALKALEDKHIQLLLFTTKAGGVGLDMSAASCLIWLQHPWSMVEYLQAEDRIRRIGSERHDRIDVIHIITKGTVEQDKLRRLNEKMLRLDEITQDRMRLRAAGLDTITLDNEEQVISGAFLGSL